MSRLGSATSPYLLQDDLPDVTPEDRLPQAAPGASVPVGVTESAPARR